MNEEYKEYDLLPCPWCENPVHMEGNDLEGYYITCGHVTCDCPTRVIYYNKNEAIENWNNGIDFERINSIRKEKV